MKKFPACIFLIFCLITGRLGAAPVGTAFTYQGSLSDAGARANGTYDLQFALYDAPTNGNQVGPIITNLALAVTNGIFTSVLDFGPSSFNGSALWLSVGVRTNLAHVFTPLTPLQALTASPFANYAIIGNVSGVITNSLTVNSNLLVGGTITGNGAGLTNLNASAFTNVTSNTFLAGPNNAASAAPAWRTLANGDFPATLSPAFSGANINNLNAGNLSGTGTNLNLYQLNSFGRANFGTNATFPMPSDSVLLQIPDYGYLHLGNSLSEAFSLWWNPVHYPDGEAQFTSFGRISLLAGYDGQNNAAIQIGAPGSAAFNYFAANKQPSSDADPLGNSLDLDWETQYLSNGVRYWYFPGMRSEARKTNGAAGHWALTFYDRRQTPSSQLVNVVANGVPGTVAGLAILDNGTEQHGKIVTDEAALTAGPSFGVDFDGAQGTEIIMTQSLNVTNISTEWARTNQATERRLTFYGGVSGYPISFPTNWLWYNDAGTAAAPANVASNRVLIVTVRQEVASMVNYFAHASMASYSPFSDPDAQNYVARGNITDGLTKAAIDTLVTGLKSDGTWSKLFELWPCAMATAQACTNGLKNAFNGVSHGSMTFVPGGMKGDGATAYFDTRFLPSSGLASKDSFCVGFSLQATNATIVSGQYPCGCDDGAAWAAITTDALAFYPFGLNNGTIGNPIAPASSNWKGTWVLNRTAASPQVFYQDYAKTRSTIGATTSIPAGATYFYFMAEEHSGAVLAGSECSFTMNCLFIGQNFTDSDVGSITARIKTFNTALGR